MSEGIRIVPLPADDKEIIDQTARLLIEAFRHRSAAWPDVASALPEVQESLGPGRVSLVAIGPDSRVVGWVGGQPHYDGRVWELHPLCVAESLRRQGIGRELVEALEQEVASRGGITLWLGADDEDFETSLGGIDLYNDLPASLGSFTYREGYPYPFYSSVGFRLIGVMPDANGPGKPDIYMAKRVAPPAIRGSA